MEKPLKKISEGQIEAAASLLTRCFATLDGASFDVKKRRAAEDCLQAVPSGEVKK